ncbi:PAS domain-containing protein [Sphingomonas crocodyli]|uniref:PAS domain-containing protein n=1 Tax=Sphingomonas crocodyli TaxID=1979270 RepID=A0A437LYN6_9SPHN|nr:PAS domain-containing protein [Sphingomonas crocodyli]RVT90456.1 PAS domain-containing protein [Sphingomonas crocodyli]
MDERKDWHLTDDIEHERGRGDPFAAAVRATRMPMVITDPNRPDNPIVFCNKAFQQLTGYERSEIIGRNCRFLQGPDTDRNDVRKVREAIEAGRDVDVDLLNYRKDGSTFWNALYLSPVRGEANDIQFFFASQLDVTDRVEAQRVIAEQKMIVEEEVERRTAQLSAALEAKTVLLHEVDHRVKNNLTMIGSLLRLQARTIGNAEISAKLEAMLERIDALATVHRRLYESDDVNLFDIGAFTENLVADVVGAAGRVEIEARVDVDRINVPSSIAAALGLMINEILTNALKHAYAHQGGTLTVSAKRDNDRARITIADDGPGFDADMPPVQGLGTLLVKRLAKQATAEVAWASSGAGTVVTVTFPMADA